MDITQKVLETCVFQRQICIPADDNLRAFPKFKTLEKLISKQFSNFFSCYTQAFNKQQQRKGSLFILRMSLTKKRLAFPSALLLLENCIRRPPLR